MSTLVSHGKRGLTALLVAVALCGGAHAVRADPIIYQKTLRGTGWIIIPVADNKYDWGTCWILDRQKKLVVTNYHVVKDNVNVRVRFPHWIDDQVQVDANYYWHKVKYHSGKVVHVDKTRDLALVELESIPDHVQQLRLAPKSALVGETVHSVGNSSVNHQLIDTGSLWRYTRGEVRLVRQHAIRLDSVKITVNCRILETSSPINIGDSGGPVVNSQGDVVGVVSSFETATRSVTWNIDVSEVRTFQQDYLKGKQK